VESLCLRGRRASSDVPVASVSAGGFAVTRRERRRTEREWAGAPICGRRSGARRAVLIVLRASQNARPQPLPFQRFAERLRKRFCQTSSSGNVWMTLGAAICVIPAPL